MNNVTTILSLMFVYEAYDFSEVTNLPDEEMLEIFSPTGEDRDDTSSIVAFANQLPVPITGRRKMAPNFLLTAPDLEQRDPKYVIILITILLPKHIW